MRRFARFTALALLASGVLVVAPAPPAQAVM